MKSENVILVYQVRLSDHRRLIVDKAFGDITNEKTDIFAGKFYESIRTEIGKYQLKLDTSELQMKAQAREAFLALLAGFSRENFCDPSRANSVTRENSESCAKIQTQSQLRISSEKKIPSGNRAPSGIKIQADQDWARAYSTGAILLEDQSKLFFNWSHSVGFAVFAFARIQVGVDLEQVRPKSQLWKREQEKRKIFSKQEFSELQNIFMKQSSDEKFWKRFFEIWTLKESILKLSRRGLAGLKSLTMEQDDSASGIASRSKCFYFSVDLVNQQPAKQFVYTVSTYDQSEIEIIDLTLDQNP